MRSGRAHAEIGYGQGRGDERRLALEHEIPVVDFRMRSGRDVLSLRRAIRLLQPYDVHHFHVAEPVLMLASMRTPALRVYTHRAGKIEYRKRQALRYRLAAPMIRRFDAITGAPQAAEAAESLFGIPSSAVHATWNGVDPEVLKPSVPREELRRRYGFDPDTVLIGTAARLRELKRVDLLIEAVSGLALDDKWQLVVVGDGPDRARLEALAKASPVGARITFVGMYPVIGDWLAALDVFALPSGGEESFGNAAVEAMVVGLPTIVFADSPALADHVTDGETGFVVETTTELSRRLRRLIEDAGLRRRVGAASAALVASRYSMAGIVERFDSIYSLAQESADGAQQP